MSDDLTRFLTVLLWAGVAWAFLALTAGAAREHLAEVRRTLDHVTWGECPRCGKDDCWCDRDGEPTPAEIADAIAIRDAEEAWVLLVCAECGRVDCTHGAVALHEAARQADADWSEWEREVTR